MSTKQAVLQALQEFGVIAKGTNRYRSRSPYRKDSNSLSFTITFKDDEHGAFYDHVDKCGGSLYQLAEFLGIDTSKKDMKTTKRAYTGLADYAAAHGVTAEHLANYQWKEVQYINRRALSFATRSGLRWRFIDGQEPVYMSERGYQKSAYGLSVWLAGQLQLGKPLVISNGEISVASGVFWKVPTMCVTAGEVAWPDAILQEVVSWFGELRPLILVALDCDNTGRKASIAIANQFREYGLTAIPIDLGLGDKGDLADFCMLYREESLDRLLECKPLKEKEEVSNGKRLYKADELGELPPLIWIIEGEILEHGLHLFYGKSGVGKSFITLDYALRIAQDRCVIYIASEGQAGFHGRVEAWKHHNQLPSGDLYFYMENLALLSPSDMQMFVELIRPYLPDLVIIDTMARAMEGGDENSSRDMGLLIGACGRLQKELGTAVLVIHHAAKNGSAERGSSALRGACDLVITVENEDDVMVLYSAKTKDASAFHPKYYRLEPVTVTIDGNEMKSAVAVLTERTVAKKSDKLSPSKMKLLELLSMEIYQDSGASWADIRQSGRVPDGSLSRALSGLLTLAYVTKYGDNYKITSLGLAAQSPQSPQSVQSPQSTDSENDSNMIL